MPLPIPIAIISPAEARLCCVGKQVGNGIAAAVTNELNKNAATVADLMEMAIVLIVFTAYSLILRGTYSRNHMSNYDAAQRREDDQL